MSYALKSWNTDDDILQRIALQLEDVQRVSELCKIQMIWSVDVTDTFLFCAPVEPEQCIVG